MSQLARKWTTPVLVRAAYLAGAGVAMSDIARASGVVSGGAVQTALARAGLKLGAMQALPSDALPVVLGPMSPEVLAVWTEAGRRRGLTAQGCMRRLIVCIGDDPDPQWWINKVIDDISDDVSA